MTFNVTPIGTIEMSEGAYFDIQWEWDDRDLWEEDWLVGNQLITYSVYRRNTLLATSITQQHDFLTFSTTVEDPPSTEAAEIWRATPKPVLADETTVVYYDLVDDGAVLVDVAIQKTLSVTIKNVN